MTAGVWFGRSEDRAIALVVSGTRAVRLEPVDTVLGEDHRVVIRGESLRPAEEVGALMNHGRYGTTRCEPEPGVELPRFHFVCEANPNDASAWLVLDVRPPGRLLGRSAANLLVWPSGETDNVYRRPSFADADPVESEDVAMRGIRRDAQQREGLGGASGADPRHGPERDRDRARPLLLLRLVRRLDGRRGGPRGAGDDGGLGRRRDRPEGPDVGELGAAERRPRGVAGDRARVSDQSRGAALSGCGPHRHRSPARAGRGAHRHRRHVRHLFAVLRGGSRRQRAEGVPQAPRGAPGARPALASAPRRRRAALHPGRERRAGGRGPGGLAGRPAPGELRDPATAGAGLGRPGLRPRVPRVSRRFPDRSPRSAWRSESRTSSRRARPGGVTS